MDPSQKDYEIVITEFARHAYFQILDYLYEHYTEERAEEVALELIETPQILKKFPLRGKIEPLLINRRLEYRFILYKRSRHATVKIIYYITSSPNRVYITDFFPTEMYPKKVLRSK